MMVRHDHASQCTLWVLLAAGKLPGYVGYGLLSARRRRLAQQQADPVQGCRGSRHRLEALPGALGDVQQRMAAICEIKHPHQSMLVERVEHLRFAVGASDGLIQTSPTELGFTVWAGIAPDRVSFDTIDDASKDPEGVVE